VRRLRRTLTALALAGATLAAGSGCGFNGIYSLPLPGAVANGGHTYTVQVEFRDVLDLVPYSAVKVNGATVGHVADVKYQDGHADVGCKILDSAHLPANAVARIEQTSVLGEKFVEIDAPTNTAPQGRLVSGDTIGLARTDTDASVEEVLGALSALINGGGVQQIHTIAEELHSALNGRTAVARDLLNQLRDFTGGLNDQKAQIIRAISGVNDLAQTVKGQEGELVGALQALPPALHILADDRHQLTKMLTSVAHLGRVAVRVIHASRQSLLTNLRLLKPTLAKLGDVGSVIPKTLGIIITYPTADSVEKEYFGDYGNLSLTVDLSRDSLLTFIKGLQLGSITNSSTTSSPANKATTTTTHHTSQPKSTGKQSVKQKLQQVLKTITHSVPSTDLGGLLGLKP
jgi:phospholipid/cholesterol/gamma-HCH transport system substrate-binding protein